MGLLPIMWSTGAGADVMKRIAAPLVGGVLTSGLVVLLLFPVVYYLWKVRELPEPSAPESEGPVPRMERPTGFP